MSLIRDAQHPTTQMRLVRQIAVLLLLSAAMAAQQPATPEQQSPARPQVTYRNGLLTIQAFNSSLADILNAVRRETGATLEAVNSVGSERVVVQLGPAPPQAVLSDLFAGSRFDYIILGSLNGGLQRIIVRARGTGATNGGTATAGVPRPPQDQDENAESEQPEVEQPDENPPPEQAQPQAQPQPPPQPPPQQQQVPNIGTPAAPAPGTSTPQTQQPLQSTPQIGTPIAPPPGVKTPEQLLEELRQMQQQQQQQNPPPQVSPR